MNSEVKDEFDRKYEERVRKIGEAATAAIKELDRLRSGRFVRQEVVDAEVTRIAREKLHPHGCDLAVHWADGVAHLLITVQSTGRRYDLIKSFPHRDNGR